MILFYIVANIGMLFCIHYLTRDLLLRRYLSNLCDRVIEAYASNPIPDEEASKRADFLVSLIYSRFTLSIILGYKEITDESLFTEDELKLLFNLK